MTQLAQITGMFTVTTTGATGADLLRGGAGMTSCWPIRA